jgi:hypothetical protein
MQRWIRLQRFWREISPRAFATFLLAVGTTFSAMGFLGDIVALDKQPFSTGLYSAAVSGLSSIAFAAAFTRSFRWIVLAIALQVSGSWFLSGLANDAPWARFRHLTTAERLRYDRLGAVTAILLGYNGFLFFIGGEGRRWVAVHAEMNLAHQIHQTLVPPIALTLGRTEFMGASHPSGLVGGDLVDVLELPNGGWLAYVADVTGHGVSSGLIMGMVKSAVRMGAADRASLPELVRDLNRLMCSQLSPQMFVTLAVVRGGPGLHVEAVTAGHPPLLRVGRGQASISQGPSGEDLPIGVTPDWTFTSHPVPFEPGDLLVLVTDGLFEVFDAGDRDLGLEGIKGAVLQNAALPLADLARAVVERSRLFGPQLDDQTILLLRRS